jgi:hypothetical protein
MRMMRWLKLIVLTAFYFVAFFMLLGLSFEAPKSLDEIAKNPVLYGIQLCLVVVVIHGARMVYRAVKRSKPSGPPLLTWRGVGKYVSIRFFIPLSFYTVMSGGTKRPMLALGMIGALAAFLAIASALAIWLGNKAE